MDTKIMAYEKYDINFYKLAGWLTPKWLRKETFVFLVRSCFYPLVLIHNEFIRYRDAKLYELSINYQVCYLEAFLNDRFDFIQRRIYIEDAESQEQLYIYQEEELKPIWLNQESEDDPVYLFTEGESMGDLLNDFVVYVPADIVFQEAEMRAMIKKNLSGKRYKIELF